MISKLKNVIIFVVIGGVLFFAYTFFIKGDEPVEDLVPTTPMAITPGTAPTAANIQNPSSNADFLTLLLNVKNIKLNDAIFVNPAFKSLSDSSILLTQDGTEGRPNPFAPFGSEEAGIEAGATTTTGTNITTPSTSGSR